MTRKAKVKPIRAWAVLYFGERIVPERLHETKKAADNFAAMLNNPIVIPVEIRPVERKVKRGKN